MTIKKRLVIMFAPLIIILLSLLTFYTQYTARKESVELAYTTALSIAADQSSDVMNRLLNVETYISTVAEELSEKISVEQITKRSDIKKTLSSLKKREAAPPFWGLGIIIPDFDGKNSSYMGTEEGNAKGQFATYISTDENGQGAFSVINNFEEKEFFYPTYTTGKTNLTDARHSGISEELIVTFSAPIKVKGKVIGVVFADINLKTLSSIVAASKVPYKGGYAFLTTNTGTVIGHPNKDSLLKNLRQFSSVDKTKITEELASDEVVRESGFLSTGTPVLTLIYPFNVAISEDGHPWYFGVILPTYEVMAKSNTNLYKTIGICAVGIVLALVITFLVANNIASSVQRISAFSSEISKGNYDASVSTKGFTKELIALKESLSSMVSALLQTMQEATESKNAAEEGLKKAEVAMNEAQIAKDAAEASQQAILQASENIENVSSRLSAAAEELSAQVEESSRSAEQQREQVGVSVSAMEEMNNTILNVAANASSAAEGSQKTKDRAEEGATIVKDSVLSISQVESNIQILQEEMLGLKTQAESIGSIMTVISDIADQTNLLALNAAIEAARAGEYGRGFAVVADEVRKLAEKTMSATGEVGQAVTGIQNRMIRSVEALDVTTSNLDKSTELVTNSGNSLAAIVDDALVSAGQISSIATAVEEQSASCQHINGSLADINRISDEVATVMRESSQAVLDLSRQASELEDLVSHLRSSS